MRLKTPIGVDLDEVVCDFSGRYKRYSREYFNVPTPGWVQRTWNHDFVTPEQDDFIWHKIDETPNFWETLDVLEGTSLLRDAQRYLQLYFITSRKATAGDSPETQSMRWLQKHFGITHPKVVVTDLKGQASNVLQLSAIIDDKPYHLRQVEKYSPGTRLFIRDHTFNRDMKDSNVKRVADLDEFLEAQS